MKIYINGRFLTQHPTGVQFFAQELCKEIESEVDYEILVPKNQPIINNTFNLKVKAIGTLKGYLWEQVSLPNFIKKQPHCILINLCNLAPISIKNQIITIHDLAFIKNKSWFSLPFQKVYNFIVPRIINNSKAIITVSDTIKNEIVSHFSVDNDKINVIYNKLNNKLINSKHIQPNLPITPKSFYLMVGSNNPRKNFDFVESIFAKHLTTENLVIVGADHASFNAETKTSKLNIYRIKHATPNELSWLYNNCKALINPSFYEGFGIPNIEAMFFKAPILCSNIPVFKEVCGNYASYFNLNDETDFIAKLKTLKPYLEENNKVDFFQNQNRVNQIKKIINK